MAERARKLVLIYPPITAPCSMPLGIAMLKGFIERSLGNWSVRTIDLNARLFREMEGMAAAGQLRDPRTRDPRTLVQGLAFEIALLRAFEVFRGEHLEEFFQRPDYYTVYADLFRNMVMREVASAGSLQTIFDKGPPPPATLGKMIADVLADKPDAVGISVNYDAQIWSSLCLAMGIKALRNIPIVFGGTAFCVNGTRLMAQHHEVIDAVVDGEGELPLAGLLSSGFNPAGVPGVIWWDNGQVRRNEPVLEKDLDRLGAPDFSDFGPKDYFSPLPVVPVLTSRGCYWRRCAFCVHYRSAGLTYRCRSMAGVVEELRRHYERGVRHFDFVDEMLSPAQFERLADALLAAKLPIAYYAMAKPTHHFDQPLLAKMRASGCRYLLWGVESGSQRVLDLMDKGTRIEQVAGVLRASAKAGIANHLFIFFGFPTETREEMTQTLQFLHANQASIWAVHNGLFGLEEGSPIFDNPGRYGVSNIVPSSDYRSGARYTYDCPAGLPRPQVREAYERNKAFLSSFNPFASNLANFREHALLVYDRVGGLDISSRQVPQFVPA